MNSESTEHSDWSYQETYELLSTLPCTIEEIRRLNRETLMLFPLPMLAAISECGINFEKRKDAIVHQVFVDDGETVRLEYHIRHEDKLIGVIEPVDNPKPGYRAVKRLKVSDFT